MKTKSNKYWRDLNTGDILLLIAFVFFIKVCREFQIKSGFVCFPTLWNEF